MPCRPPAYGSDVASGCARPVSSPRDVLGGFMVESGPHCGSVLWEAVEEFCGMVLSHFVRRELVLHGRVIATLHADSTFDARLSASGEPDGGD